MRVLSFVKDGRVRLGLHTEAGVVDVAAAASVAALAGAVGPADQFGGSLGVKLGRLLAGTVLPSTMEELISQGQEGLDCLRRLDDALSQLPYGELRGVGVLLDEETIKYAPVVARPEKILCIGLNYVSHIEETRSRTDLPKYPEVFSVAGNALAAHKQPIKLPPTAEQYDYEAELVIVMGKECSMVPEGEALECVFGYTCGNDISARDLQKRTTQWFLGKSLDGFAPVGPCVATVGSIDPGNLGISMRRGGTTVQSSNTRNLIFGCAYLVSYLSRYLTLRPGDLIFTGTPSGVILGMPQEERRWLRPGETLTVSIEGIGELVNTMV